MFQKREPVGTFAPTGDKMGRGSIESVGLNAYMRDMTMFGFQMRALRSAGILLNRR